MRRLAREDFSNERRPRCSRRTTTCMTAAKLPVTASAPARGRRRRLASPTGHRCEIRRRLRRGGHGILLRRCPNPEGSSGGPARHRRPAMPEDRLICLVADRWRRRGSVICAPSLPDIVEKLGCEIEDVEAVLGVLQGFGARLPAWRRPRPFRMLGAATEGGRPSRSGHGHAAHPARPRWSRRDHRPALSSCATSMPKTLRRHAGGNSHSQSPSRAWLSAPSRWRRWCSDVFVRVGNDGGWKVELNSDTLPRLLVNSRY